MPCSRVVRSDLTLLGRVLRNFLANAIRYTPAGPGAARLSAPRRRVRIEVFDTGCGIPESSSTARFSRSSGSSTASRRGQELRSRACHRQAHRPRARPYDRRALGVGKGSAFWIDVPAGALPQALPKREAPPIALDTLSSALVAVIDDQDSILAGMRELLQGWGCTAVVAVDGRTAALELARTGRSPDIVIADFHLDGGATGVDAVEAFREVYGHTVPGLIITADRSPKVTEIVRRHGFHLLRKPVKPAKLRALLSHLLVQRANANVDVAAQPW